jgi:hypothetical protein
MDDITQFVDRSRTVCGRFAAIGGQGTRDKSATWLLAPVPRSVPKTHETPAEQGFRKWSGPASIR